MGTKATASDWDINGHAQIQFSFSCSVLIDHYLKIIRNRQIRDQRQVVRIGGYRTGPLEYRSIHAQRRIDLLRASLRTQLKEFMPSGAKNVLRHIKFMPNGAKNVLHHELKRLTTRSSHLLRPDNIDQANHWELEESILELSSLSKFPQLLMDYDADYKAGGDEEMSKPVVDNSDNAVFLLAVREAKSAMFAAYQEIVEAREMYTNKMQTAIERQVRHNFH